METHDQVLEAMLKSTGEWITLHTWDREKADLDADGWMDRFGDRIGSGSATLPWRGWVDLSAFCAIRIRIG